MKQMYLNLLKTGLPLLFLLTFQVGHTQICPDGSPQGGLAYDTTIKLGSGVVSTSVKFPKFNPTGGMVTCVNLCITIKGVIDTTAVENYETGSNTYGYTYTRKDTITGPGIPTQLTSNANINSPNYPLAPTNGIPGSGPDFYSQGPDTILTRILCANIGDSTTIAQFYGTNDSVTYNYKVDASLLAHFSGASVSQFILSSAMVNFHFSYCTCPAIVLAQPLNVTEFKVAKVADTKAALQWKGLENEYIVYHYEAELSRNGRNFSTIGSFEKNTLTGEPYKFLYTAPNGENGIFYFRIKQVYANGYVRYSDVREVTLGNSVAAKFSVYPNPSTGVVGIKFDNNSAGRYTIQVYNTQGQVIVEKAVAVSGSSYVQVANLKSGSYWLRLTDEKSQLACVNQLLIK